MKRVVGLQVPQIVITEERNEEVKKRIPSIKLTIEGVSSSSSEDVDDDDNETETRTRLRPNSLR